MEKYYQITFLNEFTKSLAEKYNKKALEILSELSPKKTSLWEYTDFNLILTGSECSFPIHRDTPNKLLSGVIYLHPQKIQALFFTAMIKVTILLLLNGNKIELYFFQETKKFIS